MANSNLFQQYLQPVRSVADYAADMDKRESNQLALVGQRRQNELAALTADQTRETLAQSAAKRNALQAIYANPAAADPIAREKLMLSNPLLASDGQAAQKVRLDAENTQAQARERGATADKTSFQLQVEKANKAISDISSLGSVQDAVASLEAHHKAGDLDDAKYQSVMATLQPVMQDPSQFSKWQRTMVLNIMDAKDRLAATAPKIEYQRAGDRLVPTNMNADAPGGLGSPAGVAPIKVGVSPDTVANNAVQIRGQDKADARARDANNLTKEANATVYDPERGILVNKATGLARPAATMDGKPVGAKDRPLAEGAQKQLVGTRNLQDAVGNYVSKLQGWGNASMLSPDKRAEMGNAYNNMMLQAKEAYNLGVLNGPDYDILQSVVKDPTKITSAITSNEALKGQAKELARIAKGIENRVLEAHGKPTTPAASAAMSPQDQQAAEWAKANPNDPRAAKIKQRLGL